MNMEHKPADNTKGYWFSIEPYVYVSRGKDRLLLYNSLSGKALEYKSTQAGGQKIFTLMETLQAPGNLRVAPLSGEDLQDPGVSQLVTDARRYFMGDLIDVSYSKGKPVQMMPAVTIVKDAGKLENEPHRSAGEDIMRYLTEIFLYINNACSRQCAVCDAGFMQFPCCTARDNQDNELDLVKIKNFFKELTSTSLTSLNILGGDIFSHTRFEELMKMLNPLPVKKTFYSHYLNITAGSEKLRLFNPAASLLKIPVTFPINREGLAIALDATDKAKLQAEVVFIIQNEIEYEQAEAVISSLRIGRSEYQPWYNGENLEFFKENIFTDKEDILASKPTLKTIHTNSVVNAPNFGRLTIFSNGEIFANVNAARLGILGEHSLYDVLYREMHEGKSWRRIRKNVEPCKGCTLEALCPPLSNYTYAIGRSDLCNRA
jgi:pseudo-rSAM protein